MIKRIAAIAMNTFREAIRNKILYILLVFAVVMILFSVILAILSIGQEQKIIKDVGLSAIIFFGVLISIMVGIGLIYNELDKRTIYVIVSKPIHRYEFVLGKFFGLLLTLAVNVVLMSVVFFLLVLFRQPVTQIIDQFVFWLGRVTPHEMWLMLKHAASTFSQGLNNLPELLPLTKAIAFSFLELTIITALAVMFSSFSTPILSAVFTFILFIVGHMTQDLLMLAQNLAKKGTGIAMVIANFAQFVAYILPDLEVLNIRNHVVSGVPVTWSLTQAAVYALFYTACVLIIAMVAFERRNFK
ncbi:MAG: ABC transporter permease subunit [bacterium]|nr:ABC transporter permease subunit [bacterium]